MSRADKARLRAELRQRLSSLSVTRRLQAAAEVGCSLAGLWHGWHRPPVASFWPVGPEIDIRPWLSSLMEAGHRVLLPRVIPGRRLAWHVVTSPDQLVAAAFGLREPDPGICPRVSLPCGALVVVPGLGFGLQGQRLGQGGGYYDRALAGARGRALRPVAVGYKEQLTDNLPVSSLDAKIPRMVLR